ncbi:MAG: hypothetical protein AB8F74_17275, partial [Saprospiraceae bacterium]
MKIFGLQRFKGWTAMSLPSKLRTAQRALLLTLALLAGSTQNAKAQIVINEISDDGTIELMNMGTSMVDVSSYWLCNFPAYEQMSGLTLECGSLMMQPGDILAVANAITFDPADGEMGLYTVNNFASSDAIINYVEWGSTGHQRSAVAVAAGLWNTGDFLPGLNAGQAAAYSGTGNGATAWAVTDEPTICAANSGGCEVVGGVLEGGPFEFCTGDGNVDTATGITLTGNDGPNSQWVVTDADGVILGLPAAIEDVDFDGAGGGNCLIWNLTFEDGLEGAMMGANAADLVGCFELSNSITVVRNNVNGGTLEGGPFEFCVDDGVADNVSGITLSGNEGTNSQWVVTDADGNILGLPANIEDVDFEGVFPGTCLIWNLSFEDGLQGAMMGANAADLVGCFNLSNPIEVIRNEGDDCATPCDVTGGTLEGGPFEFCTGDGNVDTATGITLTGNNGPNSQ